jgi:DNA mismatch repair ATPase MutS
LKELESSLLSARESLAQLEYELFTDLLHSVAEQTEKLQRASQSVAALDALCSLAETAAKNRYVCPEVEISAPCASWREAPRGGADAKGQSLCAERHIPERWR